MTANLSFAVGDPVQRVCAGEWAVTFADDGSTYIANAGLQSDLKVSLHPGSWRLAYSNDFYRTRVPGAVIGGDRLIQRWAPPPSDAHGFRMFAKILTPWTSVRERDVDIRPFSQTSVYVPPPAVGRASVIALGRLDHPGKVSSPLELRGGLILVGTMTVPGLASIFIAHLSQDCPDLSGFLPQGARAQLFNGVTRDDVRGELRMTAFGWSEGVLLLMDAFGVRGQIEGPVP